MKITSQTRKNMIIEKLVEKGAIEMDAIWQVARLENVFHSNRHFVSGKPKRISLKLNDKGTISRIAVTLDTHHEVTLNRDFMVVPRRFEYKCDNGGHFKCRMIPMDIYK